MKKKLLILALLAIMLPAKAQQKYEVINDGTKYLIVFPVSSTSTEISNPMIGLRKSHFEDYINCLRKYKSKAQEWEKSAQEVGVTNYEKPFKSPREKGTLLNIKRAYYTVEGQTYYNIYDYMGFSPLYMTPYFHVDEQGECFIYLKASVGRKNLETGNIYKSTSTALESTTTTEYTQIDCGTYYIRVNIEQMEDYIEELQECLKLFEEAKVKKKSLDNFDKLLKQR